MRSDAYSTQYPLFLRICLDLQCSCDSIGRLIICLTVGRENEEQVTLAEVPRHYFVGFFERCLVVCSASRVVNFLDANVFGLFVVNLGAGFTVEHNDGNAAVSIVVDIFDNLGDGVKLLRPSGARH